MPVAATLSGRGEAVHLSGVRISPQVLAMLDATPLMGRLLEPREEANGLDRVAVISYSMWQRRLGGDDAILGKTIVLDGVQYEVAGVMRPGFQFPNADAEFWTPFVWRPQAQPVVVGRMNPGASFLSASKEVDDLMQRAREERRSAAVRTPTGPLASPGAPPHPGPPSLPDLNLRQDQVARRLRRDQVEPRPLHLDRVKARHLHRAGTRSTWRRDRSWIRRGSSSSACKVS
jgi:hypothetical protein